MINTIYSELQKSFYLVIPTYVNYTTIPQELETVRHIHPVYHFFVSMEGEGILETDYGRFYLKEKKIALIDPNQLHIFRRHSKPFTYFTFNFYLVPLLNFTEGNRNLSDFITALENESPISEMRPLNEIFRIEKQESLLKFSIPRWKKICDRIKYLPFDLTKEVINFNSGNYTSEYFKVITALTCFLSDFIDLLQPEPLDNIESEMKPSWLTIATAEYLQTHCCQKYSLRKMAIDLGYSAEYICTKFADETGMSPGKFMQRQKIMKACELLRTTSKSITMIAQDLSFSSSQHFSTVFKDIKGITPIHFRKRPEL